MKEQWQQIIELGKRATGPAGDARIVAVNELQYFAVTVFPDMAAKLIAMEKLCEQSGKHVNVEELRRVIRVE